MDALCIVRDDLVAKEYYIQRMREIYSRSLLTIIALSGVNTNSALPGVVAGSRVPYTDASRVLGARR